MARLYKARLGKAGHGVARRCLALQGKDATDFHGTAGHGWTWRILARLGIARLGSAWQRLGPA
jgi:hypothetical protein